MTMTLAYFTKAHQEAEKAKCLNTLTVKRTDELLRLILGE